MEMWDVIVVGAGASGIGAAKSLIEQDGVERVLLVDARSRVGGRTETVVDERFATHPLELGAEFIHGDKAVTHDLLSTFGMTSLPVVRMKNLWWKGVHRDKAPESQLISKVYDGLNSLEAVKFAAHEDPSLAEFLHQHCGIKTEEEKKLADVLLAQTCCADINKLSARDLQREMSVDHAGHEEFRIAEGYAQLWSCYLNDNSSSSPQSGPSSSVSKKLVIQLNTSIRSIIKLSSSHEASFTLKAKSTDKDVEFRTKAVIVTVPLSILQSSISKGDDHCSIRFQPPLSQRTQRAIMSFKMEPATKLVYSFACSKILWEPTLTYLAHDGIVARWWTPSYRQDQTLPLSTQLITAYITADRARYIDSLPEEEALLLGLSELSTLLKVPLHYLQTNLKAFKRVSWSMDPCARGGYAYLQAGKWKELGEDPRKALAEPELEEEGTITSGGSQGLFFAGEATAYDTNPQTVHGALETGWRASRECVNWLRSESTRRKAKL